LQGRCGPLSTFRSKDYSKKTLIDYVCLPEYLSNDIILLEVKNDCPYEIFDHYPVIVNLNIDLLSSPSGRAKLNRKKLKWSKADNFERMMYKTEIDRLLNFDSETDNITSKDIEQFTNLLSNSLHMAANSCIPSGFFRPYLKPYWKQNRLNDFHYEQRKARRQWINDNKPRDSCNSSYSNYKDKKREFRKRKRAAKKLWQEQKFEDFKCAAEMDISEFYRKVRRMRKNGPSVTKLSYNGITANTDENVCNLWANYFGDLYSQQCSDSFDDSFCCEVTSNVQSYFGNSDNEPIGVLENVITKDEICDQIKSLKLNKAPGPDDITNEHIKYGGQQIVKYLTRLYNMIIKVEYLPLSFRHGSIIPIYKRNNKDKSLPNSYRAVTLTSTLGKLLEKILLCRIQKHLECINTTVPHGLQFGFVKEHGSIPAIYTIKEAIMYYVERNSTVFSIFLDNEKAFDRIWQDGLFFKLWNIGITEKMWKIIYMSYKTATAHVQFNLLTSRVFQIKQGVGQGRVMSAWLFGLFINDLITKLLETSCGLMIGQLHIPTVLLADDTTLLSGTKSGLQTLLNVVNDYAHQWRLKYNATKSACLVFNPLKPTVKQNNMDYEFILRDVVIPIKHSVIYAGTLIDCSLRTLDRTEKACSKLKQNLHSLFSIGVKRDGMNPITNSIIWKRVVLPTALYACEIWGQISNHEREILEQTQRYFVRYILGFDKTSPTDSSISVFGLWTLEGLVDKFKLLFYGRLCRAKHWTIHKQLFRFRLSQILIGELNNRSITYDIVKTLVRYDMLSFLENYITDSYIPDKRLWSRIVSQSVEINEENKWKLSVQCRPELHRFYCIHNCLTEHRLLRLAAVNPILTKQLLIMVKLGAMAIKEGQCTLCDNYTVDIVKHLFTHCSELLNLRNKLYYAIVDILSVSDSVKFFDQDEDDVLIAILGGSNDFIDSINSDIWQNLMYCLANHIFQIYGRFRDVLLKYKYNFGH